MLNAFKIKEFDLRPIFEQWKDGPTFNGTKKDMPVEEWLEKIREGCVERGVPEEYWYKVAQHFMGPKARARLYELRQVIGKVHGGKYRWTWKKFKVAVINMGWNIDKDAKETIKVQGRGSSLWFTRKKDTTHVPDAKDNTEPETNRRTSGSWFSKQPIVEEPEEEELPIQQAPRRRPTRSATVSGFWPPRMNTKSEKEKELPQRPSHLKANSDSVIVRSKSKQKNDSTVVPRSQTENGEVVTATTQVPSWLLNACTALEYITGEHPKAMSILSAILITAGSIPAIPAIAAGAGGAVLASSTAHAIGAIAVGMGQALGASVAQQQKKQESHGTITEH